MILTTIEPEVLGERTSSNSSSMSPLFSGSMISLRELFENVNPKDGRFLKYVPDGFLNEEQKKSKKIAFERQEKEYQKFNKEKRTTVC